MVTVCNTLLERVSEAGNITTFSNYLDKHLISKALKASDHVLVNGINIDRYLIVGMKMVS